MPTPLKISELPVATSMGTTAITPIEEGGVTKGITRDNLANSLLSAALSNIPFFVLECSANPTQPGSVDGGNFYDSNCAELGDFYWEFWARLGTGGGSGHYLISEGYGGNHAILFDGSGGNVYDGVGSTSFGADTGPYALQWAHMAVGLWNGLIVVYYDGVPVGSKTFAGPRRASTSGGSNLFIAGSDHNDFLGRLMAVRGFEGVNPLTSGQLNAFRPSTTFGPQWSIGPAFPQANLIYVFDHAQQIIQDKSAGYPFGHVHPGRIRGTGFGFGNSYTVDRSNYPAPQFVADVSAPNTFASVAPTQPAGKIYSPPAAPTGALIYDSFERKNSTFAWEGIGGLGSTESGSLGPKAWNDRLLTGITEHSFGILNEKAVLLGNEDHSRAYVETGLTDLDISVDRNPSRVWGMGDSTAIIFRYVDDSNYWFVLGQPNGATEQCYVYKIVAGATTLVNGATPAAFNWTTLRVITKSTGLIKTYLDAANQYDNTGSLDTALASNTKCGLFCLNSNSNSGLSYRWKNFVVKPG